MYVYIYFKKIISFYVRIILSTILYFFIIYFFIVHNILIVFSLVFYKHNFFA